MILERFLEVMLVESLRWRSISQDSLSAGLLAGLRDAPLAGALRALHADVRHGWTVAELAKHAGMSRSAFATRFATTIGCAPMEYLSRWRMSLAQDALSRGGMSLDRLAERSAMNPPARSAPLFGDDWAARRVRLRDRAVFPNRP